MRYTGEYLTVYDFNSLELLCHALAYKCSTENNIDFKSAYFKLNFRNPQPVTGTIGLFVKAAVSNVFVYCSQNFLLRNKYKSPSTKDIKAEFFRLCYCSPNQYEINSCANWFMTKIKDLDNDYYVINTWQSMNIAKICSINKINKSNENVTILFNKIYNRNPINKELLLIQSLEPEFNQEQTANVFQEIYRPVDEVDYGIGRRKRRGSNRPTS